MKNILLAATAIVMLSSTQQVSAMQACPDITAKTLKQYLDGQSEWTFVALQKGYTMEQYFFVLDPKNAAKDVEITNIPHHGDDCMYGLTYSAPVGGVGSYFPYGSFKFILGKHKMPDAPVATYSEWLVACTAKGCRAVSAVGEAKDTVVEVIRDIKNTLDQVSPAIREKYKVVEDLRNAATYAAEVVTPAVEKQFITGSPAEKEYTRSQKDFAVQGTKLIEAAKKSDDPALKELAEKIEEKFAEKK